MNLVDLGSPASEPGSVRRSTSTFPLVVASDLLKHNAPISYLVEIKQAIEQAEKRFGPMVLLIIDTLARFISPGDENKAQDMGAYLNAVDELRGDATSITLHHPGHGDASRGRGSSSWRGGVDAEYTLAASNNVITVTCQKMKDGEKSPAFSFKVTPAPLGALEERASKNPNVAWTDNEIRDIAKGLGMYRNRTREAILGLRSAGYLMGTIGGSYLPHMRPNDRNASESADSDGTQATENALSSIEECNSDASSVTNTVCRQCDGEGCNWCKH